MIAADFHAARGIAGVLGELARRGGAERADLARLEAHPLAVDLGAGLLEQAERLLVATKLDADLAEDAIGMPLDEVQAVFAEEIVISYAPGDIGRRGAFGRLAPLPQAIAAATTAPAAPCASFGRRWSRHVSTPSLPVYPVPHVYLSRMLTVLVAP